MAEHLFIGGPADGKRIEVNDRQYVLVLEDKSLPITRALADIPSELIFRTAEYRREQIRDGDGKIHDVFVTNGVSVVSSLIAGYRQP